jgi:hypothetical protein
MPTNSLSRLFFSTSGNIGNAGCRSWSRAKLAFGIAFAGMAMTAGQVRAVVVNVGGQDWDVTQFHGNYHTNAIPFQTPANGGVVPWMGLGWVLDGFCILYGEIGFACERIKSLDPLLPAHAA